MTTAVAERDEVEREVTDPAQQRPEPAPDRESPTAEPDPGTASPADLLVLQAGAGNGAVAELMAQRAEPGNAASDEAVEMGVAAGDVAHPAAAESTIETTAGSASAGGPAVGPAPVAVADLAGLAQEEVGEPEAESRGVAETLATAEPAGDEAVGPGQASTSVQEEVSQTAAGSDELARLLPGPSSAPVSAAPEPPTVVGPAGQGSRPGPPNQPKLPAPPRASAAAAPAAPATSVPTGVGGRISASPVDVAGPATVAEGAEEVVAAVVAAGAEGQASLAASVETQLIVLESTVTDQQAVLEQTTVDEISSVDGAFDGAKDRMGSSIAAAQQRLQQLGEAEQARLAAWSSDADGRLSQGFDQRVSRVRQVGTTKAADATAAADAAGSNAQTRVDSMASQARDRGAQRAANPGGSDDEGRQARAAAAREVATDTAGQITGSLGDTVSQLRGLGPETAAQLQEQANQVADQILAQLPTIAAALGETATGAGDQLAQAIGSGAESLAALGTQLLTQLTELQVSLQTSIREEVDGAKQSVAEAGALAMSSGQQQHQVAAEAASALLEEILGGIGNRRMRRATAARLSGELSTVVRQGFATTEEQATAALAEIVQVFGTTADQAAEAVRVAADTARQQATDTVTDGEQQADTSVDDLVTQLVAVITAAIDSGEGTLSTTFTSLDGTAADVDTRLGEALTQFRDALAQRAGEAAGRAQEPLTSLDGRMDRAMQEAEEATHRSWWENALRAIPWGTIAGIVVGLVVTIAVVALLGTGIGALIVAGALAGALSVAATTLTDNAIAGRATNWSELGRQMLVGAAFGAIGGALGGGVTGALGAAVERQLVTRVAAVAIGKAANVVTGAALGVVQNVATGHPWHEGLIMNIGMSVAMSYGPGGRFIEHTTSRARGAMVESGHAFNVTAAEAAAVRAPTGGGDSAGPVGGETPVSAEGPVAGETAVRETPEPAPVAEPVEAPAVPEAAEVLPAAAESVAEPAAPRDSTEPVASHEVTEPVPEGASAESPAAPALEEAEPRAPGREPDAEPTLVDDDPTAETTLSDDEPTRPDIRPDEMEPVPVEEAAAEHLPDIDDLPEGSVISGGEPMSPSEARSVFENCRTDSPHREAGIYRNTETGECIVVQGEPGRVDTTGRNRAFTEFVEGRAGEPGRWELIEHSHPVDPATGTTNPAQRYPSGRGGDFSVAQNESILRGNQPVEQNMTIVTERGSETHTYGYDPTNERPYSLTVPDEHGNPVTRRFRSLEAYGEWYESQPGTGGGSPHIEGDAPTAGAPNDTGNTATGEPTRAGEPTGETTSAAEPRPTGEIDTPPAVSETEPVPGEETATPREGEATPPTSAADPVAAVRASKEQGRAALERIAQLERSPEVLAARRADRGFEAEIRNAQRNESGHTLGEQLDRAHADAAAAAELGDPAWTTEANGPFQDVLSRIEALESRLRRIAEGDLPGEQIVNGPYRDDPAGRAEARARVEQSPETRAEFRRRVSADEIVGAPPTEGGTGTAGHARSKHGWTNEMQASLLNSPDRIFTGVNENGRAVDIYYRNNGDILVTPAGAKDQVVTAYGPSDPGGGTATPVTDFTNDGNYVEINPRNGRPLPPAGE